MKDLLFCPIAQISATEPVNYVVILHFRIKLFEHFQVGNHKMTRQYLKKESLRQNVKL